MNRHNKFMLAAVLLALLLTVVVSSTLAYLTDLTDPVQNVFTPGTLPPDIDETFNGTVKENVTIKNTGTVSAYIRAMVVITWEDASGNVLGTAPVSGTDYSISYGSGWTGPDANGFYYYHAVVPAQGSTTALVERCEVLGAAPVDGYTLHVEIITQTIQAEGMGGDVNSAQDAFAHALGN